MRRREKRILLGVTAALGVGGFGVLVLALANGGKPTAPTPAPSPGPITVPPPERAMVQLDDVVDAYGAWTIYDANILPPNELPKGMLVASLSLLSPIGNSVDSGGFPAEGWLRLHALAHTIFIAPEQLHPNGDRLLALDAAPLDWAQLIT